MRLLAALSGPQPLVMGLAIVGCATAGLLTHTLDEAGWLGIVGGVAGVGGVATTAHVVGAQVNAAASSQAAASSLPATGSTGTV